MGKSKLHRAITLAMAAIGMSSAAAASNVVREPDTKMRGHVIGVYVDANGVPISDDVARAHGLESARFERKNLVVTTGKALMATLWCGSGTAPTHLACGSGSTAEAVGQTALVTETGRVAADSRTPAGAAATFVATVPAGTATGTINEIGLFNAASAGTMTQRALTGTITKPAGLGIQFTWTTTFS